MFIRKVELVGLPPLRFKWTKAYLLRPVDNIISHPDALRKRPFRPSFESHGAPYLPSLIQYDYLRVWQREHQQFQCRKAALIVPRKKFSPYRKCPIRGTYCGGKCAPQPPPPCRFTMRKFRCVPARVDHCGIDLKRRRRQQLLCAAACGAAPCAPVCC